MMFQFQKMIGLRWIPSCAPVCCRYCGCLPYPFIKDATIKQSQLQSAYCSFKIYQSDKVFVCALVL
jgi:hypothetical protein